MKPFLTLNLKDPDKKPEDANLSTPENNQAQQPASGKKLSHIAQRAAHKAAVHSRGGSSLFSK